MPRKLILQMHMSLDGYVAGPNQGMDWLNMNWDDEMKSYVNNTVMGSVDHILLGRKLAEGFIPAWKSRPADGDGVKFMNECPKTVYSNSLKENPWGAVVEVVGGELEQVVKKLKDEEGKGDVIVYGGVQMVQALIAGGVVDELFLIVDPVSLGDGSRLFTTRASYEVIEARRFECGSVILRYKPQA